MKKFINLKVVKLSTHYNWYGRDEGYTIREIRMNNTKFKEREGWTIDLSKFAKHRTDDVSEIELENYLNHPQFVNTLVSIDEIAQIETEPRNLLIYKNENEFKIISIYELRVKTGRGRGINGIDHEMYITEDSFNNLKNGYGPVFDMF